MTAEIVHEAIVVGSGPAGIACALGLAEHGAAVTIIDGGLTLEPELEARRAARAAGTPPAAAGGIAATAPRDGSRLPTKLSFGSRFSYDIPMAGDAVRHDGSGLDGSYAVGGLSNVWGAALLGYRASDMTDWPVDPAMLDRSYRAAMELLPLAAEVDGLADLFPLYKVPENEALLSGQGRALLGRLGRSRSWLEADGISFGAARLAVDVAGTRSGLDCTLCGRCFDGCDRDLIYSSRQSLADLRRRFGVRYRPGLIVKSAEESGDLVRLDCRRPDGAREVLSAARVFLAAGVVNSTAIMLRSLGAYDVPIKILDSQYYLVPFWDTGGRSADLSAAHPALSQAFLEVENTALSRFTLHLQLYGYSEGIDRELRRVAPLAWLPALRNWTLGHLLLGQGYLHSADSGHVVARLHKGGEGDVLALEGHPSAASRPIIRRLLALLAKKARTTGARPIARLLRMTEPGRGFHSGGSFPMRREPGPRETDVLGRLPGFTRLHIVDASVFPSIAATTITLTAMANAHRIGAEASRLVSRKEKAWTAT